MSGVLGTELQNGPMEKLNFPSLAVSQRFGRLTQKISFHSGGEFNPATSAHARRS